ncbi:MAG TPA: PKD domain-containing protein [Chitinophagales bacterium]|nr:PKD domain-containing protein [Chitinophagales bacterium]
MKRQLQTCVLFSILCCQTTAQVYFNRIFDNQYQGHSMYDGFSSHFELDEKVFVCGSSFHPNNLPMVAFTKLLDDSGNIIWERNYEYMQVRRGTGVVPYDAVRINDSVIVMNIYAHDSTELGTDIFLQALNLNGDSLWFQNLDAGYNDRATKMLLDKDGGLLILGFYYLGDSDSSRIIIIKTDFGGNKIWQREYGQPSSYNFAYDWYKTDDGGYILAGTRNDNNNQNTNFLLMKLDSSFNEEWSESYDTGFLDFLGGLSALVVTDDGYILVGQQVYFAVSTGTERAKGFIVKTDKSGNKVWDKLIGYQYNDIGFTGIVEAGLNEYVLLGVISIDSGWNGMPRAVLAKMDTTGNIFWQREYNYYNGSDSDHVYPSMITRTTNGDYLISGAVLYLKQPTPPNDAWLMKTDSCGFTEGDVSVAQIQLDTLIDKTITLQNTSPAYCSWQWYFGDGDSSSFRNPAHTYNDTGTYTISLVTRAGNDWDTAYLQIHVGDTSTAIGQQSTVVKAQFRLYPNPASSQIAVSGYIPETEGNVSLEFYDVHGKMVKRYGFESGLLNTHLRTDAFADGLYGYRVSAGAQQVTAGRLMIIH